MLSTNFYKRTLTLSIVLILYANLVCGQSKSEIEDLLMDVSTVSDSKDIIKNQSALKISDYQEEALNILTDFFTDDTKINVYSKCLKRKLSKGELAIILCDRIEIIPYFELINMQNFTLLFCKDNPNFVEPYLDIIKKQSPAKFRDKYAQWLHSDKRSSTKIYSY